MVKKATTVIDEHSGVVPEKQAAASKLGQVGSSDVGGLFRFTLITALGSILAVLLGAYVVKTYVLDVAVRESGERLVVAYGRQYVGVYDQIFSQASRQIAGISASGQLPDLLVQRDAARIREAAASIAASLANNAQAYLIPSSGPVMDMPLGYAAQNMIEKAQRGESLKAEVIPLKDRPLLLLAQSIRNRDAAIVGVLLIGFDLREIGVNLKALDAAAGRMMLQQKFEDSSEAVAVMAYGDERHITSPYSATINTINPHLSVIFWLNPQAATSPALGLFWIFIAVMALLVLVSIFLTSTFLRRTLEREASKLLLHAERLIRREKPPIGVRFETRLFDGVARSLKRTAGDFPGRGEAPALAAAPAGPSGNDLRDGMEVFEMAVDEEASVERDSVAVDKNELLIPPEIFRAYDIRGVVGKTLTDEVVRLIGCALGSEVLDAGQSAIYVGRDGRLSGPQLSEVLIGGIISTGCRAIDLGMVPTPLLYFATASTDIKSGVCLTGSHNPADYNGLKMVVNGETLSEQRIQALRQRILALNFHKGAGARETREINAAYQAYIQNDTVLARRIKIVVDCGNGVAGAVAPQLLASLGCDVVPLFCDVDGHFPNHHPDPGNPDNLQDLLKAVAENQADLGIAFDGDGDRIGVVTPQGKIIWPDRLMMLYAKDVLMRNPGADIIYDVKCTRDLAAIISRYGGRPVMWRTGHSLIKAKLKELGAALAGEMSGHIFFNDRWFGFDDAMYAAARLLEILSLDVRSIDDIFDEFPANISTPEIHIQVNEERKFKIIEALQAKGKFSGGGMITLDGVRVDYPASWGLVRASNTTPALVARFEGKTKADLDAVCAVFRKQLLKIDSSLNIPF